MHTANEWLGSLLRGDVTLIAGWCGVALILRLIRIQNPQVRRALCLAALVLGLAWIPWRVDVPWVRADVVASSERTTRTEASASLPVSQDSPRLLRFNPPFDAPIKEQAAPIVQWQVARTPARLAAGLLAIWGVGVIVLAGIGWRRYVRFGVEVTRLPAASEPWLREWTDALRDAGVGLEADARFSQQTGPLLYRSLTRGYILVLNEPQWTELPPAARRIILRHEAAHIQRHDVWWSFAMNALALVHWYNPLTWRLIGWADEFAEWACDERACRTPEDRTTLARALLTIAERSSIVPPVAVQPAARRRGLALRVRRVLDSHQTEDSRMKRWIVLSLASFMLAIGFTQLNLTAMDDHDDSQLDKGKAAKAAAPKELQEKPETAHASPADKEAFASNGEAVIDMSYVFKNCKSFLAKTKALKEKVAESSDSMKQRAKSIQYLKSRLSKLSTPAKEELATETARLDAELRVETSAHRRRLVNAESEVYKSTYKAILKEVAAYAKAHGIRIVRRADHRTNKIDKLDNPSSIVQAVNRNVVYIADDTMDITDIILERLNKAHEQDCDDEEAY